VGDLRDRAPGGRVERLERAAVGGRDPLAVDHEFVPAGGELAGGVGELFG
jgi:hypothetical protein